MDIPVQSDKIHIDRDIQLVISELDRLSAFDVAGSDSLYSGNLGKVITNMALCKYTGDVRYANRAKEVLRLCVKRFGEAQGLRFTTAMSNGLSGLGCVMLILDREGYLTIEDTTSDLVKWLAKNVYEKARSEIPQGDLDPLHSSIGGLYFLAKYADFDSTEGKQYLRSLVSLLNTQLEKNKYGYFILNKRYKKGGFVNIEIGLGHGLCGIILSLIEVYRVLHDDVSKSILHSLLDFLKNLYMGYQEDEEYFLFPRSVSVNGMSSNQEVKRSLNMGWCSSDLTVGYAFLKAGLILEDENWSYLGNRIVSDFMKYDKENLPVSEATFCHGYVGIAWVLKKCWHITNRQDCLENSSIWLEKSFTNRTTCSREEGLLEGQLGIYLTILNSKLGKRALWGNIFLL